LALRAEAAKRTLAKELDERKRAEKHREILETMGSTQALTGHFPYYIRKTKVVLEDGITIGGKSIREHLGVLNIRDVLGWLEDVVQKKSPVTEDTVSEIHGIVMKGILPDAAGFYRRHPVCISGAGHVPPNWVKVPRLMQDFSAWLESGPGREHPVVHAAKAHIELVKIHPLIDGNGRTARLLTSLLLMRSGYPPAMYTSGSRPEYMQAADGPSEAVSPVSPRRAVKPLASALGIYAAVLPKRLEGWPPGVRILAPAATPRGRSAWGRGNFTGLVRRRQSNWVCARRSMRTSRRG